MIGVLPRPVVPIAAPCAAPLLQVEELRAEIRTELRTLTAVHDVSFSISRGKTLALVGETGSGKSMTALSLLRLLPEPTGISGGRILLRSRKVGEVDIAQLSDTADVLYRIRGGVVSYVSQEPLSALSPVHCIGGQIYEAVRLHARVSRAAAKQRVLDMLRKVGLSEPERIYRQYPHELSGGMRQRVVIAMALVCGPELVVADEPTTALDVTTQAQVLGLLKSLQQEIGCSILLITHDMGVVAQMADEVAVMYYGRIVEQGDVRRVLKNPLHPYTRGLLQSMPALSSGPRLNAISGSAPSLLSPPAGCPFHPRCPHAQEQICNLGAAPLLRDFGEGHSASCHRVEDLGVGVGAAAGESSLR